MKKKLIKATVLIAIATLVMLNIQILFDTSDSTIFKGSTVMAQEEESTYLTDIDPTRFYPMRVLQNRTCWDFDLEMGAFFYPASGTLIPIPYIKDMGISTDGEKWICKKEDQIVYCDSEKMTDCQGDEAGEESSEEDSEQ